MYLTHNQYYPINNARHEQSKQLFHSLGVQQFGYRLNTNAISKVLQQSAVEMASDVSTESGD